MSSNQGVYRMLVLSAILLMLGCGAREGSSQGMTWQVIITWPRNASESEHLQAATERVREITSDLTGVVRIESGVLLASSTLNKPNSHLLLVTSETTSETPNEINQRLAELHQDLRAMGIELNYVEFDDIQDATARVRGSTLGHLKRLHIFPVEESDAEKVQRLERVMRELPSKVSAIERLQWGIRFKNKRIENEKTWGVRVTFKDVAARDKCLANPAYKEFEELCGNRSSYYDYLAE